MKQTIDISEIRYKGQISDTVGDMLTRIRNASHALKDEVAVPSSKLLENVARNLQGQTRLARAARARERQQARSCEQRLDFGELLLPADETGDLLRQVVGVCIERLERRKVGGQIRRDNLKHALGADQVLQPPLAHVAQGDVLREVIAHQFRGGERHQDLKGGGGQRVELLLRHG